MRCERALGATECWDAMRCSVVAALSGVLTICAFALESVHVCLLLSVVWMSQRRRVWTVARGAERTGRRSDEARRGGGGGEGRTTRDREAKRGQDGKDREATRMRRVGERDASEGSSSSSGDESQDSWARRAVTRPLCVRFTARQCPLSVHLSGACLLA